MVLSTVITSEEVNYLIYRYLLEAGFVHSAFTFGQESFVSQSEIRPSEVAPGLLISVLQRGLQYSALEHHINEDGSEKKCSRAYNLLQTHVCDDVEDEATTLGGKTDTEMMTDQENNANANPISREVDGPIQSSISNLNLALQNASIMAANAVYGNTGGSIASSTSKASSSTNSTTPATGQHGAASSTNGGGPAKKKKKESKERKDKDAASTVKDVEMGDSNAAPVSSNVVEIKTEDSNEMMEGKSSEENQFTEEEIVELIGHQSEVIGCAWNPQLKNILASASGDSTVRLWTFPGAVSGLFQVNPRTVNKNCKSLEHVLIKDAERSSDVTCLEWRRDGALLATGCYDGKARIWSSQGDLQRTLQKHTGPIFAVRWNLNGRFLLTCGIDGLAIIWDVEAGGVRYSLQHHKTACLDADWRNETQFATSGSDQTVHFYDISRAPAEGTGEPFNPSCTLSGHLSEVNTVKFDPSGRWLATCSDDSTVRLWTFDSDATSATCVQVLTAHTKEVYTLKWSPLVGSGVFASASFDCSVILWRVSGDNDNDASVTSMTLSRHTQPVYAIAFSPCGKYLASGSLDETLHIWDVNRGIVLRSYSAIGHGGIFDLEWRDSNWLAAGNSQGRVIVLEFNYEIESESSASASATNEEKQQQNDPVLPQVSEVEDGECVDDDDADDDAEQVTTNVNITPESDSMIE